MNIFCPNCEKETECEHTAELYECKECGEDFAQYIVSRKPSNSDVSVTEDVLKDIKTPQPAENCEVHEFHFTEALRNVAKSRPADVSAIGVSILIDHVEELEAENKSIRHILSLWKKTEAMKEIDCIAREIIQRFLDDPHGCRFCDYGVLRKPDNPLKGHDEDCLYLAARAYLSNETSTGVKRELTDAEIEHLGACEAENE